MKRFLKVGDAFSKMAWQPGLRQVEMTAVAAIRGSFAATIVPVGRTAPALCRNI
jgi:hypothetical protein